MVNTSIFIFNVELDEDDSDNSKTSNEGDKIDVKICLNGNIRGFFIPLTSIGLKKVFSQLTPKGSDLTIRIFYRDSEGDTISILNGTDLR